eukprot:15321506-Ditylum_brightwellii.AAC.1
MKKDVQQATPSILASGAHIALLNKPRSHEQYRLKNTAFNLGLNRFLVLPIHCKPCKCKCGKTINMISSHYFGCSALSKKWLHNQLVDANYIAACTVADYSPLLQDKNDVLYKPTNVIPNYPTVYPLNFALQKDDGLFGINTTTTSAEPLAKIPQNQEKRTATLHRQKKMFKWRGTSRANKTTKGNVDDLDEETVMEEEVPGSEIMQCLLDKDIQMLLGRPRLHMVQKRNTQLIV